METSFYQSQLDQPHPGRAREIIKAHPEVRQLMVRNPYTALIALSMVVLQTSIAIGMGQQYGCLLIASHCHGCRYR
jgi:sphingolipid delta-4 desaturase